MSELNRREFVKKTGVGMAAISSFYIGAPKGIAGPNDRVRHAGIGLGGQGTRLCETLAGFDDVDIVALCDLDPERLAAARAKMPNPDKIKVYKDFRELLEDPDIDTVSVGTPDHWHAPVAIAGVLAGKHVYVEKPCSHNIHEARMLVEAAKKTGKCVQHGTQHRSGPGVIEGIQAVHEGIVGKVRMAKAINSQMRGPIGKTVPSDPPPGVDYDFWLGPAEKTPFTENRWHYNWHWWWDLGTGDLGNDGIHQVDVARWGLNVDFPKRVTAAGGQLFYDDDHETPDTQVVTYDFGDSYLLYEMRLWTNYPLEGMDNGVIFYGDEGTFTIGRAGCHIHRIGGEREQFSGGADLGANLRNFVDCARAGDPSKLNAGIEIAYRSVALVHLGNIATRVGAILEYDPETGAIPNHEEANRLVKRSYRKGYELPAV